MTTTSTLLSDAQRQQFHNDGFVVLDQVIPADMLAMLRSECDRLVAEADERQAGEKPSQQSDRNINLKGQRYFLPAYKTKGSDKVEQFLFSDVMAQLCCDTLGDQAYLFVDQFVVKAAEVGASFSWHQDSGYIGYAHKPYLTCWCPLDDVSPENGTVDILPMSRSGIRQVKDHEFKQGSSDMVGYTGDDPGDPVIAKAGSIAAFSSLTFHRSGANTTPRPRRVYVVQYSPEPILNEAGTEPRHMAELFIKDGKRVR